MKAGDSAAPDGAAAEAGRGPRRRQVAVSVVLLVVAMFMYRGFREQLANGPGYRTDHLF